MIACAECGRLVSLDFIAIADYCPSCKSCPFPEDHGNGG